MGGAKGNLLRKALDSATLRKEFLWVILLFSGWAISVVGRKENAYS